MALAPLGAQVRPYRDFLTPALHRRFNKASRYTLVLCYATAVWMGEWDSLLWALSPVGPTGLRALLLFLPALAIYLLRVAQWHVGARHTQSPAETAKKYLFRKATLLTLAFYLFSAWLYSETYIWSRSPQHKLGFTELGREYERIKLNERPLYLRYLFMLLAVAQTAVHLCNDYDKIHVPAMAPRTEPHSATSALSTRRSPKPRHVLVTALPTMATRSASVAAAVWIAGSALYFFGPRHVAWEYYYRFSRKLWSLSKTSKPTGLSPFAPLALQFVTEGTLLVLLWEFVNKAFDLYIAQEPMKNGKPITDDSKDPNGTLLNGLKSKKDAVKAIAFWELALITDAFPDRRKTIYGEVERKKGDTFQQVTSICLAELTFLLDRINAALDPTFRSATTPENTQPAPHINLVSQISQPLRDDKQVTASAPKPVSKWDRVEATTSSIAKAYSAPGNSQQAYGREAINKGVQKAQEGAQQAESAITTWYNALVASPAGALFRHSLTRTASVVVLGAPYSRISLVCNAITALTNLAVISLTEDALGRFNQGVPDIIRVFTTALANIDIYMASVPIHWSDKGTLEKPVEEQKKVQGVEQIRECLSVGLEKVLTSFETYLGTMGLTILEIGEARKAVGRRDMIEAGR